jgi:hypothetical protein
LKFQNLACATDAGQPTVFDFNKDTYNRLADEPNQYCTKCNLALNIKNILNSIYATNGVSHGERTARRMVKSASHCNKTTTETSLQAFLDDATQEKHLVELIKTKTQDKSVQKIIIISDEYQKRHRNEITIVKAKEKLTGKKSRSLENLQTLTVKGDGGAKSVSTGKVDETAGKSQTPLDVSAQNLKHSKQKLKHRALSKSADDLSTSSNEVLDNVGSVELIFISDEFLSQSKQPEVVIVTEKKLDKKLKKQIARQRETSLKLKAKKEQKKSLKNGTPASRANKEKTLMLKDLKTTTTNSNNFLSYEEPDTPLESKTILDKVE